MSRWFAGNVQKNSHGMHQRQDISGSLEFFKLNESRGKHPLLSLCNPGNRQWKSFFCWERESRQKWKIVDSLFLRIFTTDSMDASVEDLVSRFTFFSTFLHETFCFHLANIKWQMRKFWKISGRGSWCKLYSSRKPNFLQEVEFFCQPQVNTTWHPLTRKEIRKMFINTEARSCRL